jgi:hypothetical protein
MQQTRSTNGPKLPVPTLHHEAVPGRKTDETTSKEEELNDQMISGLVFFLRVEGRFILSIK